MRNRRGVGLVDIILAITIVGAAAMLFSAAFPGSFSAIRQASETKEAAVIAQRKIEQVKFLGYENLDYEKLLAAEIIDESPSSSPYSFTNVDSLSEVLTNPSGTLAITDNNSSVKSIVVTVQWNSGGISRSVVVRSLLCDKRTKRG